jgi:argininosuccinate lyase
MGGLLSTATFDIDAMQAAADAPTAAATDLAEWLVAKGTPFRDAHAIVGALVRESLDDGIPLATLVEAHEALGVDAVPLLDRGVAVRRRSTPGGAGPDPVSVQLERFRHLVTVLRSEFPA